MKQKFTIKSNLFKTFISVSTSNSAASPCEDQLCLVLKKSCIQNVVHNILLRETNVIFTWLGSLNRVHLVTTF